VQIKYNFVSKFFIKYFALFMCFTIITINIVNCFMLYNYLASARIYTRAYNFPNNLCYQKLKIIKYLYMCFSLQPFSLIYLYFRKPKTNPPTGLNPHLSTLPWQTAYLKTVCDVCCRTILDTYGLVHRMG